LVALHRPGPFSDLLRREGIPYCTLPLNSLTGETPEVAPLLGSLVGNLSPLIRFLRRERIDIVHTNDLRTHLTWALATQLARRRFVGHFRVVLSRSPSWRLFCAMADRLVCISHTVYNSLPENGRNRAVIVENPIALAGGPLSRAEARRMLLDELGLPDGTRIIGYVGNMTRQKRPLVFLETAARIAQAQPGPVAFVLAGDNRGGELAAAVRRARDLGIADRVHFLGFRMPIEPTIAAYDLLIAPGIGDGFGRTVAEAMLIGTPVVASASGGHVEALENGRYGLLSLPDDPESFTLAALRLFERPDIAERNAREARKKAMTIYAVDKHAKRIAELYDEVLGRAAPATLQA
jgi:glycosyltransferase involved in cell wall biosynthesis